MIIDDDILFLTQKWLLDSLIQRAYTIIWEIYKDNKILFIYY